MYEGERLSWETSLTKFEGTTEWKIAKYDTEIKTVLKRLAEYYEKLMVGRWKSKPPQRSKKSDLK